MTHDSNIDSNEESEDRMCKTCISDRVYKRLQKVFTKYSPYFVPITASVTAIGVGRQYYSVVLTMNRKKEGHSITSVSGLKKNKFYFHHSTNTNTYYTEAVFCIITYVFAALVIIVWRFSRMKIHQNINHDHSNVVSRCVMKMFFFIFTHDNDNRAIITIKFGLLCVKPYLILLTKDSWERIVYQLLQLLSLLMVSYLTYCKVYYKKMQLHLQKSANNINLPKLVKRPLLRENKTVDDDERKSNDKDINTPFFQRTLTENYCIIKSYDLFGRHYLISYIITNCASYYILLMLIIYSPKPKETANYTDFINDTWVGLVYTQYIWLYFAKMYHNEIVRYFCNPQEKERIDKIVFWLKMIIVSSFVSLSSWFVIYIFTFEPQNGYQAIIITQMSFTFLAHCNSLWSLRCFKNVTLK